MNREFQPPTGLQPQMETEQGMLGNAIDSVRNMPQVVAAESYIQDGLEFIKDKIPEMPSGRRIATGAVVGGLALTGANAIESPVDREAEAHHVDPNKDPSKGSDYCIEYQPGVTGCFGEGPTRAEQCMANFRFNTALSGSIVSPNRRDGQIRGRKAVKVHVDRAEITTDELPPNDNKCNKNEFYSTAKSWVVMENDKGQMKRASKVVTAARSTSKGFDKNITIKLNKKYTCEEGPGKREWGVRTKSVGVSREANDRDRYYQFYSGKEFASPRAQFC